MASLLTDNPHSNGEISVDLGSYGSTLGRSSTLIEMSWKNAIGDAVADDSKRILAIEMKNKEFIMADIRYIRSEKSTDSSKVVVEFFFDGEIKDLKSEDDMKPQFLSLLQTRIQECVNEYFRRVIKSLSNDPNGRPKVRQLVQPDCRIDYVGTTIEDSFRDAGCMLKFIAVKIRISSECSNCIGAVVFPEHFGVTVSKSKIDPPLPKWILGMGAGAIILCVGMIYAWVQILVVGNRFN